MRLFIPNEQGVYEEVPFIKGDRGDDGVSSYIHIRYGTSATPSTLLTTPADYMGVYVGTLSTAPSTYQSYTWSKIKGENGQTGQTPNITIGTITTGAAGTSASANITGTTPNLVLNLTIPRGDLGETGVSPNISIGTVTTGAAGTSASASITGETPNLLLNLTIPKGDSDGKSAYESAQEGGYEGTEVDFYAALNAVGDIGSVLDAINGEVI